MVKKSKVNWDIDAKESLKEIYEYIKEDSPQAAVKVRRSIINSTKELSERPEKHPQDKYKKDKPGNYRAYEIYSYRIAYSISDDAIQILRIRHTSREPQEY